MKLTYTIRKGMFHRHYPSMTLACELEVNGERYVTEAEIPYDIPEQRLTSIKQDLSLRVFLDAMKPEQKEVIFKTCR